MPTTALNKNLHKAKNNKKDEFYTQLVDIENELKHYKNHFKNKVTLNSIFEILIYLTKILIIIFFWIGFLSYPLIIGWYLFYTEVTY